jgi:lipoprotein-anchoring transpeptidase ErfK/SrfK
MAIAPYPNPGKPHRGLMRGAILAAGITATALIGLGLIGADERSGMAHMAPSQVTAKHPRGALPPIATQTPKDPRFVIKRILPIAGPIKYGEWHWDEAGVPAGPLVITVDLDARVMSVFRDGYEIGTTAVLVGTQEKPTPLGVFSITQKDAKHVSNLYDAPMPFMMRLTNDGVTIHATHVQNGFASHGCIGVPLDFAATLFGKAHIGDKVYITRGKQVGVGDALVG